MSLVKKAKKLLPKNDQKKLQKVKVSEVEDVFADAAFAQEGLATESNSDAFEDEHISIQQQSDLLAKLQTKTPEEIEAEKAAEKKKQEEAKQKAILLKKK